MFGFVVDHGAPSVAHMLSGGETAVDSSASHSLGVIRDGAHGGGLTLCGQRAYGVMGLVGSGVQRPQGVCLDCEAVFEAQRRRIVPAGWSVDERDAYWQGFDRGAQFCAFMNECLGNTFGHEVPMTPWHIDRDEALKARFEEGILDGARAWGMRGEWVTPW